jgi:hypothetical protein
MGCEPLTGRIEYKNPMKKTNKQLQNLYDFMEVMMNEINSNTKQIFAEELSALDEMLEEVEVIPEEKPIHVDPILIKVYSKYQERSEMGIKKYGTTLENNSLPLMDWLNHLQEELMDATLYIEKLKQEI